MSKLFDLFMNIFRIFQKKIKFYNTKTIQLKPVFLTLISYIHLGNSTKTLLDIAQGSHPFCARLANAKKPMLLVGARTLERQDGAGVLSACHTIANNSNVLNIAEKWNGFNVLHHEGSRVGALDIGISSYANSNVTPKLVFILGADNIKTEDIPKDAFVIYQGSHGDEGSYFADLILPGSAYTEKNGTYVNTEGRVQQGRLVIPPPGLA
jgi:NADH dehydrogenase (ubiquinone) Fe-S protein 1